jgi:hypothetical protein
MNDETKKLRQIVERATAVGDRIPADLDAETASLRKTWLELGNLIERDMRSDSAPAGDAASELERAGAELAEFGRVLTAAPHVAEPSTAKAHVSAATVARRPVWTYVVAAVAASLLVAAGAFFWLHGMPAPQGQTNHELANGSGVKAPVEPGNNPNANLHQAPNSLIVVADHPEWNESVNKGVTVVSRATMAVVVPLSLF